MLEIDDIEPTTSPGVRREPVSAGNPRVVKGKMVQLTQDRIEALELRAKGWSYKKMGDYLGVSDSTARNYYMTQLEQVKVLGDQETEDHIALELVRLDYLLDRLEGAIETGDEKAINTAIRLSESRRKLLGLDKPTKISNVDEDGKTVPSISVHVTSEELFQRLETAKRALENLPVLEAPEVIEISEFSEPKTDNPTASIEDS